MPPELKAVAFRTSKLKETKDFFVNELGFDIKESSFRHFVIYAKELRIIFMESEDDMDVEIYMCNKANPGLSLLKDPNQIKIIIL